MSMLSLTPEGEAGAALLLCSSWAVVLLLLLVTRPQMCPSSLFLFYLPALVLHLALRSVCTPGFSRVAHEISAALSAASMATLLSMPFRRYVPDRNTSTTKKCLGNDISSPEDNITLGSFLTVTWLTPLISLGKKGDLDPAHIWQLPWEFRSKILSDSFRVLQGNLIRRVCTANAIDLAILGTISLGSLFCDTMLPLILSRILRSMQDSSAPGSTVMTYAFLALVVRLFDNQLSVLNTWYGRRCYERCRSEITLMIFEKALRRKTGVGAPLRKKPVSLSPEKRAEPLNTTRGNVAAVNKSWTGAISRARQLISRPKQDQTPPVAASIGTVLHILRGDTSAVAQRLSEFGDIIKAPIGLITAATLVWNFLGPSCYLGLVILFIGQALNAFLSKKLNRYGRMRKKATDERLKLTSQFIEVLRHLRWYNWQDHWLEQVFAARDEELMTRFKSSMLQTSIRYINVLSSRMFPALAFYAYAVLGKQPLRVDVIFPALQLFRLLDTKLRQVPDLITTMIDASTSVKRIEDFMAEAEFDGTTEQGDQSGHVTLQDCSFAWPSTGASVLKEVTLTLSHGLTVVCGEVGAGKTALLLSILGEMDTLSGICKMPQQRIAYCSQTPWLQSMSIRDNILFFSPYDELLYRRTLDACELLQDMSLFADGDGSFIGENGVGLSGGQKARVALARAIYSRPDVLLLDDPLAALDHDVAESIARKVFATDLLGDCIIVLATHQIGLVRQYAKHMLRVSDNRVEPIELLAVSERDNSTGDVSSLARDPQIEKPRPAAKEFVEAEQRAAYGTQLQVYWLWIAAGGFHWWILEVIALFLSQLFDILYSWYIKQWGEAYEQIRLSSIVAGLQQLSPLHGSANMKGQDFDPFHPLHGLPSPEENPTPWLLVFVAISVLPPLSTLSYMIFELLISFRASKRLFKAVMRQVSMATFRFYDVTPTGRLMNRLTSDMSVVDSQVSGQFVRLVIFATCFASSLAVIASTVPTFLVGTVGIVGVFIYTYRLYLPTSQSLRRLETVSLSPLFSSFGELLQGLVVVRVFKVQQNFLDRTIAILDRAQAMDHYYWALQAWLAFRLDNISALAVFVLTTLAVCTNVTAGLTAFVLISSQDFIQATHALCRQYGRLQTQFVSVERVEELLHIDQEPSGTIMPPAAWPTIRGDIVFEDVTIRYASHMRPALNNISVMIPGGSKVAVMGRTGSGKTTFVQSLLAIVRAEQGKILIDGQDVNEVSVSALRSRVTYVAQDPVLFAGTIRDNLDPNHEFDDEECASVLARVAPRSSLMPDAKIEAGGGNISQGERQLVGIARAVLRRSTVLILDEATASIDVGSAEQIHRVLDDELRGSTVITIAHRVEAVRGAEWKLVLAEGKVESFQAVST